jgi:IS66 C-terminal element
VDAALHQIGRGVHPAGPQSFGDRAGLAVGRVAVLLGMDGFEYVTHLADLGGRHMTEDVPIKMNHAALPPSIWQILCGAFQLLEPIGRQSNIELPYGLRRMGTIVLNRKNALFAGNDQGAENWALIASLVETCKLTGVDPLAYLADTLTKLVNLWPAARIDELMPWAWAAERSAKKLAA